MFLNVYKLEEEATTPTRKHSTDAGLDLYAYTGNRGEVFLIEPNDIAIVRTGISVDIPEGYFGWITNKSSRDYLIGGGIVDQGYQGELLVKIINTSGKKIMLYTGVAVAQLLLIPVKILDVEIRPLRERSEDLTERGADGGIARQGGL